jgi:hypothetical protein
MYFRRIRVKVKVKFKVKLKKEIFSLSDALKIRLPVPKSSSVIILFQASIQLRERRKRFMLNVLQSIMLLLLDATLATLTGLGRLPIRHFRRRE